MLLQNPFDELLLHRFETLLFYVLEIPNGRVSEERIDISRL